MLFALSSRLAKGVGWRTSQTPVLGDAPIARPKSGLKSGTAWAIAGRATSLLCAILLVPVLLGRIGLSGYGEWAAGIAVGGIVGLSDAGLGRGVLSLLPGSIESEDERARARTVISSALAIYCAIAAVGISILGILLFAFDIRGGLRTSFAVAGVVLATMPLGIFQAVQVSCRKIWRNHASVAIGTALGFGAVIALPSGAVPLLAAVWLLGPVGAIAFTAGRLLVRHPWARPHRASINAAMFREILRRSGSYGVLQICYVAAVASDVLILTWILGSRSAGEFAVPVKAVGVLTALSGVVSLGLWPVIRAARDSGDRRQLSQEPARFAVVTTSAACLAGVAIGFFGEVIVLAWTNGAVHFDLPLRIALALLVPVIHVASLLGSVMSGLDLLRPLMLSAVAMASINIGLSVLLTKTLGVSGPAWASVVAYLVAVVIPFLLLLPRWLDSAFAIHERGDVVTCGS